MHTLLAEARQVRAELWRRLFHGLRVVERGGIQLLSFMPQDASNERLHKFYCVMSSDGITRDCETGEATTGLGTRGRGYAVQGLYFHPNSGFANH